MYVLIGHARTMGTCSNLVHVRKWREVLRAVRGPRAFIGSIGRGGMLVIAGYIGSRGKGTGEREKDVVKRGGYNRLEGLELANSGIVPTTELLSITRVSAK